MLSVGEDVEASALSRRGWSISAIARHLDRDRKTVRSYLAGEREPGFRRPAGPDPLAPFAAYVAARFADDPHLWASALSGEVVPLGYGRSYVSFARQLRLAGLRPHCEACTGVTGRETTEISHPAGEEIQWDWFERRRAPWARTAYVLLGTLSHSGRTRGVLAECMDQAHLVEAMDAVMRRLDDASSPQFPDGPRATPDLGQVPDQGSCKSVHRLPRRRVHGGRHQDSRQPSAGAESERDLRKDDRYPAPGGF
jgi:hypothetical protein